ncbi:hypothetical protein Alches_19890 [Alicyclobacillus hesperidum subsp. aegles]|uniref:Uncharacterized protein n=1 Tax=Alicyclobacillus hesperidum TaxID=89784 RepID=A0AA37U4L1_9BACL|nr:hypothetical protein [Alicyclobacillus hesperidum]KRW92160.1 hypothetical protein SD51_04990 [Alicyclobacillus tengchongensis]GLG01948.1 hypothetical protein Alches_19890 [Alicyclobacillus hesperidum subsp. aegles]GLV14280.1 hypothetical protein Heshes_19640 [Alicyclobacillus hesperidum]
MKFVYWVIAVIIIIGGCLWLFNWLRRSDRPSDDYFALLEKLQARPDDNALREQIYAVGRKFYKNRMSGIDDAIQMDVDLALRGELKMPVDDRY